MRRALLLLSCWVVLVGVSEALVAHLGARDGAAMLLATWVPAVALEFGTMLALRLFVTFTGPPLIVGCLALALPSAAQR